MSEFRQLKPVVVAVSVASAFALLSSVAVANSDGHHHKHKHHHRAIDDTPIQHVTPISAEAVKLNAALDQNQGGVVEGKRNRPDWAERINISGLINVDAIYQNRTPALYSTVADGDDNLSQFRLGYFGAEAEQINSGIRIADEADSRSANDIALADANLFVDACVNHWMTTHVALQFRDSNGLQSFRQFRKHSHFNVNDLDQVITTDDGDVEGPLNLSGLDFDDDHNIRVDEAYFTLGSLEENPFYLRAGRMYAPFGKYERYTVTDSLTKLLSMTSETMVQVGAVSNMGLSGSVFVFRGLSEGNDQDSATNGKIRVRNYGANIQFAQDFDTWLYSIGASYLFNMADVDFIRDGLVSSGHRFYDRSVPAWSLNADVIVGQFDASARYVTANREFDPTDITDGDNDDGAQPSAWSVDLGFAFDMMNRHSRLGLTYQQSEDAKNLGFLQVGLPKHRWGVDYQVNILNHTDLVFEVVHDKDYSEHHGGLGGSITTGTVRLSVAFA
jgi:hypothetical protein